MSEKNVIFYSSKNCPKCRALKQWLRRNKIAFVTKSLDDTDIMTDLVMRNLFVLASPALDSENRFWMATEIFDANNRLNQDFKHFIMGEKTE